MLTILVEFVDEIVQPEDVGVRSVLLPVGTVCGHTALLRAPTQHNTYIPGGLPHVPVHLILNVSLPFKQPWQPVQIIVGHTAIYGKEIGCVSILTSLTVCASRSSTSTHSTQGHVWPVWSAFNLASFWRGCSPPQWPSLHGRG